MSPPTIQATLSGDRWTASWTVNVDAAREFPTDSYGVIQAFSAGPVFVESVESNVISVSGLLTQVLDTETEIRATNPGGNALTVEGQLVQVPQGASYLILAEAPSSSTLTIAVQLRDSRGTRRQLVATSTIFEQFCGYRGGPPC